MSPREPSTGGVSWSKRSRAPVGRIGDEMVGRWRCNQASPTASSGLRVSTTAVAGIGQLA